MSSKNLKNLLNSSEIGELADIVQRAQAMGELTVTLSAALPTDLGGSLIAANIRDDGELVVIARSPAWAARLRFETESLLAAARNTGAKVTGCSVRVSHDL
jgi:hypothetical protein